MLLELFLVANLQTEPASPTPNTLALPNNVLERWPGPLGTPGRWRNAPPGKKPFVVAATVSASIAVRWASDPTKAGTPAATYYVAMRQTDTALGEADSRECQIVPVMEDL